MRIGLDIDGTIADFDGGYLKRFKKWPNHDWAITRNVEHILSKEREFWLGLPLLRRPNFTPKLYCSARVNKKVWTKRYLSDHNLPDGPLYQIPGYHLSKAKVLKGRVDVFIEDSIKNFIDLNLHGIPCLLIDNPNNQNWGPVCRIYSLDYNEIEDAYYLAKECDIFNNFEKLVNDF